jgi:hypothetical protein
VLHIAHSPTLVAWTYLQATHVATVFLEDILRKGFSKGVRNLILGSYWEDLYKPVPYVFAKVMVTYVDVFGTRAKLWKPCKFQCTGVVFKNFAIYVGLGTGHLKTLPANFLNQKHDRKYVS